MGERVGARPAVEVEERVTAAGGLAVAARTPAEWDAHPQAAAVAPEPLVRLRADAPAAARPAPPAPPGLPAAGVRVLDLTRVIAGPVATRFLALLGADVLRVDSPRLPELEPQHLDTGAGKRSTLLDLGRPADRAASTELLADADVVVTGYRPGALDRWGLSPEALRRHRPDLVVARLSAWGGTGPWAGRRGFDSLVQAATGIAVIEAAAGRRTGRAARPGARPRHRLPARRGGAPGAGAARPRGGRLDRRPVAGGYRPVAAARPAGRAGHCRRAAGSRPVVRRAGRPRGPPPVRSAAGHGARRPAGLGEPADAVGRRRGGLAGALSAERRRKPMAQEPPELVVPDADAWRDRLAAHHAD